MTEIKQNSTELQSVVSSHFEELRSQIDQHIAKLSERIGDIAFKMKDETKIYEEIYSKSLSLIESKPKCS